MSRLPENFFNAALVEQLRALLSGIVPPAEDLLFCHADAPGWRLVDFGTAKAAGEEPGKLVTHDNLAAAFGPVVAPAPRRLVDTRLGLNASVSGSSVFWEWTTSPGATAYGRLSDERDWEALKREIERIGPSVVRLLTAGSAT